MEYSVFRDAVESFLTGNSEWTVVMETKRDSKENTGVKSEIRSEPEHDEITIEQDQGAFFIYITVSVSKLFELCRKEGWAAVQIALEEQIRRGSGGKRNRRHSCEEYEALLDEDGKTLFAKLRTLRAGISREKKVPPYIIFINRALYEMCIRLPGTIEELREVYGVGEKNSKEYGGVFLQQIKEHREEVLSADPQLPEAAIRRDNMMGA